MRNKRGSVGGIMLLVLILMIASAVGGAYGYSVLDGKMAVKDAQKEINKVDLSNYDSDEASTIQGYLDQTAKDLETARSRKEVYDILDDFKTNVSRVKTRTEKELEQARKEIEEARKSNTDADSGTETDADDTETGIDTESGDGDTGTISDGENDKNGILNSIFGSSDGSDETE